MYSAITDSNCKCLCSVHPFHQSFGVFVVKPQSINDLREPFPLPTCPSDPSQLSSSRLPPCFHPFCPNPSSYFDSNDYPHRLNETLSSLTELRSLIRDGSRCQTRSANWLVEKAEITDSEVSPVKPNLSHSQRCHFLSTVATVLALESADSRAFVDCLCSKGIFCWRTSFHWKICC